MTINRTFLALAALAAASAPVHAQDALPVRAEQEVRIQAPEAGLRRLTIATVMSATADTLVVQTAVPDTIRGGRVLGQHAVATAQLRRLEVLEGPRDPAGGMARGALIGAGAGVLGALYHKSFSDRASGPVECEVPRERCRSLPEHELAPYDARKSTIIVAAGVVIGTVVGALKPGRRWRSVLPGRVEPAAGPAEGGGVRVEGIVRF